MLIIRRQFKRYLRQKIKKQNEALKFQQTFEILYN